MKLLIIDNEIAIRSSVKSMLLACCPGISAIAEAGSVQTGIQAINSFQPDIVLLDIEMDDGSGFDLMRQVSNPCFQLIFITAHNQYAIEAFRFSAIDYLLKPVDPDELQQAIQKAIQQIQNADTSKQISFLLKQIGNKSEHGKKIVLKDIDNIYFIKVADILFCEAEGTYTRFYIKDSEPILVSKNLKEYESILEPLGFIRTHHSYLANPDRIKVFDKTDGGCLYLDNGQSIPVSQRKKESVLAVLEGRGS